MVEPEVDDPRAEGAAAGPREGVAGPVNAAVHAGDAHPECPQKGHSTDPGTAGADGHQHQHRRDGEGGGRMAAREAVAPEVLLPDRVDEIARAVAGNDELLKYLRQNEAAEGDRRDDRDDEP